jgi:hypothetical protein
LGTIKVEMQPRNDNHDAGARAREKQASRRADEHSMSSGAKSASHLRRENEAIASLANFARVNLAASRSLG